MARSFDDCSLWTRSSDAKNVQTSGSRRYGTVRKDSSSSLSRCERIAPPLGFPPPPSAV
jgi:hypothetical protein